METDMVISMMYPLSHSPVPGLTGQPWGLFVLLGVMAVVTLFAWAGGLFETER